jgi:Phosphate-starvation-inducible E family
LDLLSSPRGLTVRLDLTPPPPDNPVARTPRRPAIVEAGISWAELSIYLVAATLLLVAAVFTVVGMIKPLIEGSGSRDIGDAGVFMLDRILLLFIIAELLYTLRLVIFSGGQILVEPFLFIGLIAVVRRLLVITAEFEGKEGRTQVVDFLIQVGALAGLGFGLALSIYFLRRSDTSGEGAAG